jgi:hypothetical protein
MDIKVVNASSSFQAIPINLMHLLLDLKCIRVFLKYKEGANAPGLAFVAVKRYSIPLPNH